MRCVEAAGAKETEGDAGAGADQGGELFAIRLYSRSSLAFCYGGRGWVEEIVDEVGGFEKVYAIFFCGGEDELRD